MITELLVNLITGIIKLIAIPFNILPDTPQILVDTMNGFFDFIFSYLDFISFFVDVGTLKHVATIAIVIWTLNKSYTFLMWIIHKLPFSIE